MSDSARTGAAPDTADPQASAAAGFAVLTAATALTGVLTGGLWLGFVLVTVFVVGVAGTLLRAARLGPPLVAVGQLAALTALVTAIFTRSGTLIFLPGPEALGELRTVLVAAAGQINSGVPPVQATGELLCVVVIALGLVAILVDTLAVAANAPAAAGLVLLCVVAVPASLADSLLPAWTLILGAAGFALLLTVDDRRRHLVWGEPAGPGGHAGAGPAAIAVGAGALAAALFTGSAVTAIGTEGRLPGTGPGDGAGSSGIGLNPFTSLRGQLDNGDPVDLFLVRGMPDRSYLRALTLSTYADGEGWIRGPLDGTAPAAGAVPLPPGADGPPPGSAVEVEIEPLDYNDTWLPAFGVPLAFSGVAPDWRYDPGALTAFSERRQRAEPYGVLSVLPQPDVAALRAAPRGLTPGVDGEFLDVGALDPRVAELTRQVTADAPTPFDATLALNEFFTSPGNGFSYELETAPGSSGDALVDFLFEGRQGYCEQYASAMAVMLRTLGIPARVAVGFTPGTTAGDARLITTEDAHAWVEAWFPGAGWLIFDPTPLADGRTVVPPYVADGSVLPSVGPAPTGQEAPELPAVPTASADPAATAGADGGAGGAGAVLATVATAVVVLGVLLASAPLALRILRRRHRLRSAAAGGPAAAAAAWDEVLAESRDRGVDPPEQESVRATARRLAREHALDEPGRSGLRTLVAAVERSWYSGDPASAADPELPTALVSVRSSLDRCAPSGWVARLLPRSVLPRRR